MTLGAFFHGCSLYLAPLGALRHPSPVRHLLQRYCSKLKPKCGFVQKKLVSNEFRGPESGMTKAPTVTGRNALRGRREAGCKVDIPKTLDGANLGRAWRAHI